jgi:hypothetical protein
MVPVVPPGPAVATPAAIEGGFRDPDDVDCAVKTIAAISNFVALSRVVQMFLGQAGMAAMGVARPATRTEIVG